MIIDWLGTMIMWFVFGGGKKRMGQMTPSGGNAGVDYFVDGGWLVVVTSTVTPSSPKTSDWFFTVSLATAATTASHSCQVCVCVECGHAQQAGRGPNHQRPTLIGRFHTVPPLTSHCDWLPF